MLAHICEDGERERGERERAQKQGQAIDSQWPSSVDQNLVLGGSKKVQRQCLNMGTWGRDFTCKLL